MLLTVAGPEVGLGHLARCVAIADAFSDRGITSVLIVRGQAAEHVVTGHDVRHLDWIAQGPAGVAAMLDASDIAVVDSYEASRELLEAVAEAVPLAAYFDDTARLIYPAGLVVNGSPGARELPYRAQSGTTLLLGAAYQPLRRAFWDSPANEVREGLDRVLVMSGGTDAAGVRAELAVALRERLPGVTLDIIDAPRTAAEVRESMLRADVAVTASGQTLAELARTGTPAVALCTADNQTAHARAWEAAGSVVLAGFSEDKSAIERTAELVAGLRPQDIRSRMSRAGRSLLDGLGARRVARACSGFVLSTGVVLEPARPNDEARVLELANDPDVRAASLGTALIDPNEHHTWYGSQLANPESLMLVARRGEHLAGQVRFDIDPTTARAVTNISVAAEYRGMGLGARILEDAVAALREVRPDVRELVALVRSENLASRCLFAGAGFEESGAVDLDATRRIVEFRHRLL